MDYSEPMNKVKDRMKQLQNENAKFKERIEEIIKRNPEMLRNFDRTGFKLGMQEANNHTEKQNNEKLRQDKEEELKDWKNLLQSNKDDLLKRKEELSQAAQELKKTSEALNAEKDKLYEELDRQRTDEEHKYNDEVAKQKKSAVKNLDELAASIKISKNGDNLTFPTLRAIFDGLALFVSQTFCQLIDDYRNERREKRYNNPEFVKSFLAFEEKTRSLMANKQQEFMDKLKVTSEVFAKSIQFHANQGNRDVLQLYPMLVNKLRSFKESDRTLKKEEVLDILKMKEKLLKEKKEELVDLMKESAQAKLLPEQIFSIVQFRLSDDIARELKFEEEDITKAMKSLDYIVDPEVQEQSLKVQQANTDVMQSLLEKPL